MLGNVRLLAQHGLQRLANPTFGIVDPTFGIVAFAFAFVYKRWTRQKASFIVDISLLTFIVDIHC